MGRLIVDRGWLVVEKTSDDFLCVDAAYIALNSITAFVYDSAFLIIYANEQYFRFARADYDVDAVIEILKRILCDE